MRRFIFLFAGVFMGLAAFSQSKSVLLDSIANLNYRIDTFSLNARVMADYYKKNISENPVLKAGLSDANNKISLLQTRISRLQDSLNRLAGNNKKTDALQDSITMLKKTITSLKNTIAELKLSGGNTNSNDFLNNYFFNRQPLSNNSFKFSLAKILLRVEANNRYNRYNDDQQKANQNPVFVPEFINADGLHFYNEKGGQTAASVADFNALMPSFEVLKNKLLILTLNDSRNENYLFTLVDGNNNNFRKTQQWHLASEDVKADGTKNEARDIVWTFLAIDNECYLALDFLQLDRLGLLIKEKCGGNDYHDNLVRDFQEKRRENNVYWYDFRDTNNGQISIYRKTDRFLSAEQPICPLGMTFLFKLIPQ